MSSPGFNYLDKILDVVTRIDKNYRVRYVSKASLDWLRIEKPDCLLEIIHEDDHAEFKKLIDSGQDEVSCELRIVHDDIESWVDLIAFKMPIGEEYIVCMRDITKWKDAAETLMYASEHDVLTGLANRALLEKIVNVSITQSQYRNQKFALMLLDLDGFKKVNDTLGHATGDEILIQTSNRLTKIVRSSDLVARLGGDEFVVVLTGLEDTVMIQSLASKILKSITSSFNTSKSSNIHLSTSIGISVFPEDGTDYESLLKHADIAMYKAKEQGKNRYLFYTLDDSTADDLSIESAMFRGIHEGEFYIDYQLQYSTSTKKIVGAEALMRWESPKFGVVSPAVFIPIAENNGLITYLGTWVLRSACHQLKDFQEINPEFTMSVNVSPKQFYNGKFENTVRDVLVETGIDPSSLCLEITEGTLMLSNEKTERMFLSLRNLGVKFSIDDFGSGFSSLSYLKQFPISSLKIDKAFIEDITADNNDKAIVSAVINLAHSLNMNCVAEGVEKQDQFEFLQQQECDEVQGYFLSRPMSIDEIKKMLTEETK